MRWYPIRKCCDIYIDDDEAGPDLSFHQFDSFVIISHQTLLTKPASIQAIYSAKADDIQNKPRCSEGRE